VGAGLWLVVVGLGALRAATTSSSLLAGLHPERAAQRGGPGYHKRPVAAPSSAARSELRSGLLWSLYPAALGLTFVTNEALWSQVILYVFMTVGASVWLISFVRRRRQNQLRKL
jgi:hypothetical protein